MTRPRTAVAMLLLGGALMVPAAASSSPGLSAERARLRDYFDQNDIDRSSRYRKPAYALSFSGLAVEVAVLLLIGLRAGTRRLGELAARSGGDRWWLQVIILAAAVSLLLALVDLPFTAGREALDKSWGLSTRTPAGFLSDTAKGFLFQLVLTIIVALGFFAIVRLLPRGWPFAAGLGAVVLTVVLSMLWPLVYEPLFNKFTPVDPALRERIVALGEESGVRVGSVYVADASKRTTTQNAYVSGLGKTKRVVLYDTLLARSTPGQVDLVVAHELGHVRHNDVVKGTALASFGGVALVALIWLLLRSAAVRTWLDVTGASDPRAIPFLAMVLVLTGLLTLPVANWYSRRIEAAADRAAVRVTRDPETAVQVEVSLARSNIADLTPNPVVRFWFYSHPPVMERIQIALDEKARL